MSQFLAPIHTWLFKKILVLETIEKDIVNSFDNEVYAEKHAALLEEFGPLIPDQALESMIDESNIHGWLQAKITMAESRQAALVKILIEANEGSVEAITNIYRQAGIKEAKALGGLINNPAEVFQALNNVLLEGMPCDRVNKVVEEGEDKFVWITTTCVHKNNWENNGVDVAYFYRFRAAFSQGFVRTISNQLSYTYTNDTQQVHTLMK